MFVTASSSYYFPSAKALAEKHHWIFLENIPSPNALTYLECGDAGLILHTSLGGQHHQFQVDFLEKSFLHRLQQASFNREGLAKALGCRPKSGWRILDATAGWGRDTMILASLGFSITALESSPMVFELLSDGLLRANHHAKYSEAVSRIQLFYGNSKSYLQQSGNQFDVIYLDPMFPSREKSAAVKLNMQILQQLLGHAAQAQEDEALFQTALRCASKRVVVKRPRLAAPLGGVPPSYQLEGKSSRFDIYLSCKKQD